jgi:hypothetical protein
MLTATANSCNNCTNPLHSYLAEDEFTLTEKVELIFNKNPDKLLRADGVNNVQSSPNDFWIRTKSRQYFSDNNITVAVFFYSYS